MAKNKLNAKKKVVDDIEFDSKFEAQVYQALLKLQDEGVISKLERQIDIVLIPQFIYGKTNVRGTKMIVDFKFIYNENGAEIYFESKGWETPVFKLKLKILKYLKKDQRKAGLFSYVLYTGRLAGGVKNQKELIQERLTKEFSAKYLK